MMRRLAQRCAVLSLALVCALGAVAPSRSQQPPVRLGYLFSDGQMQGTVEAYHDLLEEHPELRQRIELHFLSESLFDDAGAAAIADADVLVLDVMNQQMVDRFDERYDTDLLARVAGRGSVLGVGEGLLPEEHYRARDVIWDPRARAFWAHSGPANQLGLMKLALDLAGVDGLDIPEPEPSLDFGYYYPGAAGGEGRVFADWDDFDRFRRQAGTASRRARAPRIAVGFYRAAYYGGDTRVLDAVIAEIERQGAEAIPLFGYPAHVAFERLLLDDAGRPRADVALAFLFRFAQPDAGTLTRIDIPILNLATLYGRSAEQWRASDTGLSLFEGTFQIATPELAGLLAPTVVGSRERLPDPESGLEVIVNAPIDERITTAVRRALRYAALREKPNREKKVALLYYDYPPGKANIGASYLNVAESIANVLGRLRDEGYDLGDGDPDELSPDAILAALSEGARNVAGHAPGELEAMLEAGDFVRVPHSDYLRWLERLTPALRREIVRDWGEPADFELMSTPGGDSAAEPSLVIPRVRYGNVVVMPQPARGWGEDLAQLYHAEDLAPHHQYVAAYLWLRAGFAADAVIHVGTHGTLEWLDGKAAGLSADDAPDALIADLPDLYIYNVDVVGEGLVARRRSAAALVDHMVPPFRKGGLYAELAELSERLDDHDLNLSKNPELARVYAEEIRERVLELGLAKDLGLDLEIEQTAGDDDATGTIDHDTMHRLRDYMIELESQNIPYGLHAFGRVPEPAHRRSTVDAIVSVDRSLLPDQKTVLSDEMERRIVASGPRELDNLVHALAGGYLPGGNGGEPVRNPDVYPTGKNFYGTDPDKIPKPAAYELGVDLADRMLADHLEAHGRYPEKVSFVIWGDETMRHEGIVESQVFHLLGTRPVWDARGNVVDVEVIPAGELGRPRVDIVIASAAEGMFYNVTRLMDEAVQKVKVLEEADNLVRRHYLSMREALVAIGYSEEEAERRAGVRIFDEAPGVFNLNTSRIVEASGSWDTDAGIANDYMKKMGHGFGNGFWGEPMEDVFRLALAGTEKIVHSSSTMLYGALDNDDFYMYMGGLATAVRNLDGTTPEMVVTNTRNPDRPEMTGIDRFLGTEFRSRYVNPTWIEGMMGEGYAGAGEIRAFVEYLWGWDATAPETVDDAMWQEAFAVYVEDEHELGLAEFFAEASPFAYQDLTARMLETVRKGYWEADAATEQRLLEEYLVSVATQGVGCSDHTCGNPRFLRHVEKRALETGIRTDLVPAFRAAMERALGADVESLAASSDDFARTNEARIARRQELARTGRVPSDVEGLVMESPQQENRTERRRDLDAPTRWGLGTWLFVLALLATLAAWRLSQRGGG